MKANISSLIGCRYKDNGNSIQEGFDCYSFVREVCKQNGRELPFYTGDSNRRGHFNDFVEDAKKRTDAFLTENPKEGDVIIFIDGKGRGFHSGIYLDNDRFIHCDRQGVHVSDLDSFFCAEKRFYTWSK